MKNKQQRYTPEFRAEAVKLVTEQGLSQEAAAKRLAIPKGTLGNWVAAAKSSNRASVPGARSAPELEAENARLRKELAEARMERDILKKRPFLEWPTPAPDQPTQGVYSLNRVSVDGGQDQMQRGARR